MVTLQDFKNVELIVARIKEVQDHPDADRLYVLKVETGSEEKQLVAGIRSSYPKEALAGRQIIMINNLEPAVIRGQESQGMLLAVGEPGGVSLLGPDREVPLGSRVR
jgi:methionyl-tRNA synthetase